MREAVPAGVNQRVGRAQHEIDPRIAKTAADMIVPFERFGEMMAIYRDGFASRGLDFAVWGHISDGNVHPNVLPRAYADVERGKEAILYFGQEVARLGGCPLAEHGVGRNPVKQALLRGLYGDAGIEEMRAVKRALDPEWKLAPGVIFPGSPSPLFIGLVLRRTVRRQRDDRTSHGSHGPNTESISAAKTTERCGRSEACSRAARRAAGGDARFRLRVAFDCRDDSYPEHACRAAFERMRRRHGSAPECAAVWSFPRPRAAVLAGRATHHRRSRRYEALQPLPCGCL